MTKNEIMKLIRNAFFSKKGFTIEEITDFTIKGPDDTVYDVQVSDFEFTIREYKKLDIEVETKYTPKGYYKISVQNMIREDGLCVEIYRDNTFVKLGIELFLDGQGQIADYQITTDPFAEPDEIQTDAFKNLFDHINNLSEDDIVSFMEKLTPEQIQVFCDEYDAQMATRGIKRKYEI